MMLLDKLENVIDCQDAIGTPYCVTVDFDTMEDETVTVRDRDTMEQIRLPINQLVDYISKKITF